MISYAEFAQALSLVIVSEYVLLLTIAVRRAQYRDRRQVMRQVSVAAQARFIEGPVIAVLFLAAIFTAAAALAIGQAEYPIIAGLTVALLRGALFILGCWLLAWYWRQRETWR